MRKSILYYILGISFFISECRHIPDQEVLTFKTVRECIENYPDSALSMLKNMPLTAALTGREQADYALLYTQACDKNNIFLTDDSLIKIAVNYYSDNKICLDAARSYYYLGCIYQNNNNHGEAIHAFLNALKILPQETTDRLAMQICYGLGESYMMEGFYEDAVSYYKLAYQNACCRKDTLDMYYPLRGIGTTYLYVSMNDSALVYYYKALDIAHLNNNSELEKYIFSSLAGYYEMQHDYENANKYATEVINIGDEDLSNMYMIKGNAYMHKGKMDSAYICLRICTKSEDLNTRTMGFYYLYELFKNMNDIRAIQYVDSFVLYKDSLNSMSQNNEIKKIQEEHHEYVIQQRLLQDRKELKFYLVGILLFIIFLGVTILVIIERKRKLHYVGLQKKLADNRLDYLKTYIKEQYGQSDELESKIKEIEEVEIHNCIGAFQKTIWHKKILLLNEQWLSLKEQKALFDDISVTFIDFIEILRGECPTIKEVDIYFCILSLMGYRLKMIACCLRTTDRNLSTRKTRLKKLLKQSVFDFVFLCN